MRFYRTLSSIAALMLLASPAKAENITIVADEWCPYNCAQDAQNPGVFIEIAKYALEKMGHTVEYKNVAWARAIEDTREGKFTAITGASKGDAPDFVFPAEPQSQSLMTFFVKAESPWRYESLASLASVSVGTIASYSYGSEFDAYVEKNIDNMKRVQVIGGETAMEDNFRKLLKGRIGALIESVDVANYYIAQNGLTGKVVEAGHLPLTEDQNLYIAFSPKHPDAEKLAQAVSDATKELRENGKLDEILARYGLKQSDEELTETP